MSGDTFQHATIYGAALTRRGFLKTGGALVVYASLAPRDACGASDRVEQLARPDPALVLD